MLTPHTVVEDQPIDAIGFHPAFWDGTTTWTVSPSLPNSLSQDSATGEITGTVDDVMIGTYTVTATHVVEQLKPLVSALTVYSIPMEMAYQMTCHQLTTQPIHQLPA